VTATVITDATGQRLMLRSSATGQAAGFRIQASDASGQPDTSGTGLSQLAFDPQNHPTLGMAANTTEYAQDAMATLNGLSIRSKTNSFADTVPGLTLQVNKVTTTPVTVTMTQNMASMKTSVQSFVTAYNAYKTICHRSPSTTARPRRPQRCKAIRPPTDCSPACARPSQGPSTPPAASTRCPPWASRWAPTVR